MIHDEFSGIASRQVRWQRRRIRDGLCSLCGKPVAIKGETLCSEHREKHREHQGCSPWHKGGRGRPPRYSRIQP